MTRGDPYRAMIQIQLWWLWEIQIEWWSRSSSDDLDRVMIRIQSSDDDPDREMIQIQWWCSMMIQIERWSRSEDDLKMKMTWRWRWLEDKDDLKMKMTWRRDDRADREKKTSAENRVERIPSYLRVSVDVYVTSECILLCILYIVTRCLFRDVSIMYLSHVVMPRCSDRED